MKTARSYDSMCPVCRQENGGGKYCSHFVGWTKDGHTIVGTNDRALTDTVDPARHILINTGISTRVFDKPTQ